MIKNMSEPKNFVINISDNVTEIVNSHYENLFQNQAFNFNEVCEDYFLQLSQVHKYAAIVILITTIINTFILPRVKKYIFKHKYYNMNDKDKKIVDEVFSFVDIMIFGTYLISSLLLLYQVFLNGYQL